MLANIRLYLKGIVTILTAIISVLTMSSVGTPTTKTPAETEYRQVKNVIYFIGDGMGPLHLEKAKQERSITLTMDTFPYQGRSMTRSLSNSVTDSAAGGTALATGTRTYNGALGVYMFDPLHLDKHPKNLTELCHENGMMTGIVTTDLTSGATPASFSVHSIVRQYTKDISTQQIASDIDLIWGGTTDYVTQSDVEAHGFTFIKTYDEMMALESGERSFAQFDNETWHVSQVDTDTPTLEQMTMKAIDLLDDTDEGFFLMVEGAHIDKNSHSNNDDGMTEALDEFDRTIAAALAYAEADGETLIVITADHETGGIVLNEDGTYSFTQGDHSDADVPVLVYGSDTIIRNGEVLNNYEIPIRIAYSLGFNETQFPCEVEETWGLQ